MKLVFLDIGLAIDTYIFQRVRTIRIQQEPSVKSPPRCARSVSAC
jgi:hypothetical protein